MSSGPRTLNPAPKWEREARGIYRPRSMTVDVYAGNTITVVMLAAGLSVVARTATHPVAVEEPESHGSELPDRYTDTAVPFELHLLQVRLEDDCERVVFAAWRQPVRRGHDRRSGVLREE